MRLITENMRRVIVLLLSAFVLLAVAPELSVAKAAPVKKSAVDQRKKAQEQKAKQREKERAQAQKKREQKAKQKAREQEQAAKQKAREQERRSNQKAKKDDRNEVESYNQKVDQIKKHNQRVAKYQTRDIHHYLGVWGFAGYSALFRTFNTATDFTDKTVGGFGGGAGLGYMLKYKNFLFNTGVEYEQYNSINKILGTDGTVFTRSFNMTPYPSMQYNYTFNDMMDNSRARYVQLPVLFGGEWNDFYFLVGPKVGMSFGSESATSALVTTDIVDKELIGPLSEMINHTLVTNEPYNRSPKVVEYGKLSYGLNLAAHFEAGMYLDRWIKPKDEDASKQKARNKNKPSFAENLRYRIGVFADYGVLNIQTASNIKYPNENLPVAFNDATNPLDLSMRPVMSIGPARDAKVNPFLVGVKFAIFYELPRKQAKMLPFPPEPMPRMSALVLDSATNQPLPGAMVSIYSKERNRTIAKTTNRAGFVVHKSRRGDYSLSAQRPGYYPSDSVAYHLESDLADTVFLYLAKMQQPVEPYLVGYVRDAETKKPLEAAVLVRDVQSGQILYEGQAADDGVFMTTLHAGSYKAHLSMAGYMPLDESFKFETDTVVLYMQRIKEGKKVVLRNMFFATNKTQILPESEEALTTLFTLLNENPSISILITGHTDAVGSDASNQRLSEGRAKAVREALITRGIDGSRIAAEGKGESEPVATNDTEEGRALNRRVEITITSMDKTDLLEVEIEKIGK